MIIVPRGFTSRTISPLTTDTPATHDGAPAASETVAPVNAPLGGGAEGLNAILPNRRHPYYLLPLQEEFGAEKSKLLYHG